MQHDALRHTQIELPAAIAEQGQSQERRDQTIDHRPRRREDIADPAEQQRVGIEKELIGEEPAQRDAKRHDIPMLLRRRIAIEIFDQQQPHDRENFTTDDLRFGQAVRGQLLRRYDIGNENRHARNKRRTEHGEPELHIWSVR